MKAILTIRDVLSALVRAQRRFPDGTSSVLYANVAEHMYASGLLRYLRGRFPGIRIDFDRFGITFYLPVPKMDVLVSCGDRGQVSVTPVPESIAKFETHATALLHLTAQILASSGAFWSATRPRL